MTSAIDIEAKAASWLVRRNAPDWSADEEARLCAWLDESDAHKAAYWRLECGWRMADRVGALGPVTAATTRPSRMWSSTDRWLPIAASLAALLLVVPMALRFVEPAQGPVPAVQLQTALGGHKQVALSDGSTVELNTATLLRAAVTTTRRDVWLDRGEAFFSVTHSGTPFVVHAGPRVITVVGTRFSVSRDGNKIRVAVVEGTVRVSDANSAEPTAEATITHGDLLQAEGAETLVMQKASARVERALAWREGMVQFDQTPLIEAAKEFNRYNDRKLVVSGPTAAMMPIGGSFQSSNAEGFARLLHDAYNLRVEYTPTEIRVSG
jgi:transmembrane sensor